MELDDFRNKHAGSTIWVLGSGATLSYVSPGFFDDKIVISTNFAGKIAGIKAQYAFSHYHQDSADILNYSDWLFTLRCDTNSQKEWVGEVPEGVVFVEQDSYAPPGASWNPLTTHPPNENSLAYGSSSIHGAMHLAAWLGASFVVLVGADCGFLDGADRIADYPVGHSPWVLYNQHHKLMKDWLLKKYGVRVYSLNPFINFNLEGHKFQGV